MNILLRAALGACLLAATSAAAMAQMVIGEPPVLPEETMAAPAPVLPDEAVIAPPILAPLDEDGAAAIAMMNGVAIVEDVDHRFWDGNFEVEGSDPAGADIEMVIDAETGAVLEVDD